MTFIDNIVIYLVWLRT